MRYIYSFNGRTQIKHTTLKYSLNKQYFFVDIISPIGFGWGDFMPMQEPRTPEKSQING